MWEEFRIAGLMTAEQKQELRESNQEHLLFKDVEGKYEIIPYKKVESVAGNSSSIRAFLFNRVGKAWVLLWHTQGEELLQIPVSKKDITLYEMQRGKKKRHEGSGNHTTISVGDCQYVVFDLPAEEEVRLLANSKVL